MCLHCIGKVSNCSIKSCGRSWSAHEGTIYSYTNTLLGKICLSSHSCHFVKNYFFLNKTPSCICSISQHCIGRVSDCSSKSCGRSWSAHEGTIYAYTKALCIYKHLIREKLSKFSLLSFCQKLFFLNQTPSCICSMCLHCIGKVSNCSIKRCGRSWSAHEGTIYAYTKALCIYKHLIREKLSKFSQLSLCQKLFFSEPNSFMHMFNVSTLYRKSSKLFHQKLW